MVYHVEGKLGIDDWRIWTGALRDHMALKWVFWWDCTYQSSDAQHFCLCVCRYVPAMVSFLGVALTLTLLAPPPN